MPTFLTWQGPQFTFTNEGWLKIMPGGNAPQGPQTKPLPPQGPQTQKPK